MEKNTPLNAGQGAAASGARVLTTAQMRAAEAAAAQAGTSYATLMENAGAAAAQQMQALAEEKNLPRTALFLCGKGNNGGDAFVAARLLHQAGWHCAMLLLCGAPAGALAQQMLAQLPAGIPTATWLSGNDAPPEADFRVGFIVDAVFGIGFDGNLPPHIRQAFALAGSTPVMRVALDLPSGLNADTGEVAEGCFTAHHTLTFGALKPALALPQCTGLAGQVHVLDIGL